MPTIHFGTGASTLLPALTRAGGDVIGLDWRIGLDDGWALVGDARPCRGTSTLPCCSARGSVSTRLRMTCSTGPGGRPGHIFNLGHGVLPRTDPETVTRLAALVQEATVQTRA